jgi:SWI/SNF-related matrix-associated actin-dependent regulator 1 of chromatin subfamily A
MERETLKDLIANKDEWAVGALLRLYEMQTADEQAYHGTVHDNGVGFNAFDAEPMTNISNWYLDKGFLTDRQLAFVRKIIQKYIGQLISLGGIEPKPIKKRAPQPKQQQGHNMTVEFVDDKKKHLKVKFWFPKGDGRFMECLNLVKSLPSRQWRPQEKFWKVASSMEAGEKLRDYGFDLSDDVALWLDSFKGDTALEIEPIDVPGLNGDLMPFQQQGIAFIESRDGRALIGDEMGLGKTIQAIGYLQLHKERRPALIVCPASLKKNWYNEIIKWMPKPGDVQILQGRKPYPIEGDIVIINYDILGTWENYLSKYRFEVSIWDECHFMKNSKAQRTKAAKKICKSTKRVIMLSGTPIVNRASEFYNSISMVRPDLFPSYWKFVHRYTNAKHNGFGWDFKGSKNGTELNKILTETIMIRRKKDDVLTELPPKLKSIVPFDLANRATYNRAEANMIAWIRENEGAEKAEKASQAQVLVEFEKLKQLALDGKMKAIIDWTDTFLNSDQKLVLFATHTKTLDILEEKFKDICVRIDGSTAQKKRQDIVDRFQEDDSIRLFLGNVKAAGVGLTLTAASNVAFVELPWTPGDFEQAADRCHRIGQEDTVNVWVLIAEDTIEESIAAILSKKQKTLDAVLDGKITEAGSVLSDLIENMKIKERMAA